MSTYFKKGSVGGIVLALIAVVLLGLAIWYVVHTSNATPVAVSPAVSTTTPADQISTTKSYTDSTFGYSFSYPSDFLLTPAAPITEVYPEATGPSLQFPQSYLTGTTISMDQSHIAVVATSTPCQSLLSAVGAENLSTSTVTLNGVPFTTINWSEGAAGHFYETDADYTTKNNVCYILTLTTSTGDPGNYFDNQADIAAQTQKNTAAQSALEAVFNQVAATFTFGK